jgi:hypothetical protein
MNSIPAHQKITNHNPKFTKGDMVRVVDTPYEGTIVNSETRAYRYNEFLYRVQSGDIVHMFFENELEHA